MSIWQITAYIIALVIILIFSKIFIKPLKSILGMCICSSLGWFFLSIFNSAFAFSGFSVATNVVTSSICGILGIPGFVLILITKLMFNV